MLKIKISLNNNKAQEIEFNVKKSVISSVTGHIREKMSL